MMRGFLITSATAALLALPAVAGAAPRQISAGDDFFSPKKPAARSFEAGPSFHWSRAGGSSNRHNIRQDDKLFFSGHATERADQLHDQRLRRLLPLLLRDSSLLGHEWRRQGPSARRSRTRWPARFSSGGPTPTPNTGSRFDVRYRVDHRKWKLWKKDTRKFQGTFGHNDRPVNFNLNRHTYKIEVRSERKQVSKRSGWSPALTLHD